jgi:hypothetical protein
VQNCSKLSEGKDRVRPFLQPEGCAPPEVGPALRISKTIIVPWQSRWAALKEQCQLLNDSRPAGFYATSNDV